MRRGTGGAKSIEIHLMKKLDAGLVGAEGGSQSKDARTQQLSKHSKVDVILL